MIISPKTIVAITRCFEEGLVFDRDWENEITQEMMDFMLYGKQCRESSDKKGLIKFLRTTNLFYMHKLIHNFLFNIVMPIVGPRDYVSDKDRFCMYNIMVGGKVNFPEFIFFYWLQAFKDRFHAKNNKNLIPYGMLFT